MLFASLSALRVGFHHAIAPVSHWEEHLSMARPIKCPPVASNPALIPKWDLLKAAEWKHNKRNDARPSLPSNLHRLHFLLHCSLAHHSSCLPDLDPILLQSYSLQLLFLCHFLSHQLHSLLQFLHERLFKGIIHPEIHIRFKFTLMSFQICDFFFCGTQQEKYYACIQCRKIFSNKWVKFGYFSSHKC